MSTSNFLRRSAIEEEAVFLLLVCAARVLRQQLISLPGPAHRHERGTRKGCP